MGPVEIKTVFKCKYKARSHSRCSQSTATRLTGNKWWCQAEARPVPETEFQSCVYLWMSRQPCSSQDCGGHWFLRFKWDSSSPRIPCFKLLWILKLNFLWNSFWIISMNLLNSCVLVGGGTLPCCWLDGRSLSRTTFTSVHFECKSERTLKIVVHSSWLSSQKGWLCDHGHQNLDSNTPPM